MSVGIETIHTKLSTTKLLLWIVSTEPTSVFVIPNIYLVLVACSVLVLYILTKLNGFWWIKWSNFCLLPFYPFYHHTTGNNFLAQYLNQFAFTTIFVNWKLQNFLETELHLPAIIIKYSAIRHRYLLFTNDLYYRVAQFLSHFIWFKTKTLKKTLKIHIHVYWYYSLRLWWFKMPITLY